MKTLTKDDRSTRTTLCTRLHDTYVALETSVETLATSLESAWSAVIEAQDAYNAAVDEANAWREEVASAIQWTIDEHSDRWQESTTGQAYQQWLAEWEGADLERIDLQMPETPNLEVDDQSERLEALPEEP